MFETIIKRILLSFSRSYSCYPLLVRLWRVVPLDKRKLPLLSGLGLFDIINHFREQTFNIDGSTAFCVVRIEQLKNRCPESKPFSLIFLSWFLYKNTRQKQLISNTLATN